MDRNAGAYHVPGLALKHFLEGGTATGEAFGQI
jgi:hypothetical protein